MTRLKLLGAAVLLSTTAFAGASHAAVLYDNGPAVGGTGVSLLTPPASTYGFGDQTASGNAVAENFTVSGSSWNVSSLDFYSYQTGAVGFTFQTATWSIVSGADVNTGSVVASGTTAVTNGGLVGYRALNTTPNDQTRAVYRVSADISDFVLGTGNYFLTWSLTGTAASGPWVPPVDGPLGGNALQSTTFGPYVTLVEAGSGLGVELPFTINGTTAAAAVPEAQTWAMMIVGFGVIGGALRQRRGKTTVNFA